MRGVQMRRPSLYELTDDMKKIDVPALIVTGDEDDPCLELAFLMKRSISTAGLVVLPYSGPTINIEEPEAFNRALFEFFMRVDESRAARSAIARLRHPRLQEMILLTIDFKTCTARSGRKWHPALSRRR
jgi:hypothetical protein